MKTLMTLLLSSSLILVACGDDDGNAQADAAANTDAMNNTPDAMVTPQMPALGATQYDRAGRPAISTALQATFDGNETSRNAAKDAYNADANPANWAAAYVGAAPAAPGMGTPGSGFRGSLAIYDSLDTVCGNQLAFTLQGGNTYATLAGVLADDRLYVNSEPTIDGTSGSGCNFGYLAVEANATGIVGNDDCGGRLLRNDVIDISYNVLATGDVPGVTCGGAGQPACPVTDNADANDVEFLTTFPYLAPAQN